MFYHEFILQQFKSCFTVHAPFHYFQLVDESFCNAVGNIESDSVSYSLEISFNTYNKCLQWRYTGIPILFHPPDKFHRFTALDNFAETFQCLLHLCEPSKRHQSVKSRLLRLVHILSLERHVDNRCDTFNREQFWPIVLRLFLLCIWFPILGSVTSMSIREIFVVVIEWG